MLGIFSCFCCHLLTFSKKSSRKTIRASNSLDPDHDLDPNRLQRLSADNTLNASKEIVIHVCTAIQPSRMSKHTSGKKHLSRKCFKNGSGENALMHRPFLTINDYLRVLHKISCDMCFQIMWHFDKCRLRRACAASVKLRNYKLCLVSSLTVI